MQCASLLADFYTKDCGAYDRPTDANAMEGVKTLQCRHGAAYSVFIAKVLDLVQQNVTLYPLHITMAPTERQ